MSGKNKTVRRSISLPSTIASRVAAIARNRKASANRVLVELIEEGLESASSERERFYRLTDRLAATQDRAELQRIKQELARMTFGA